MRFNGAETMPRIRGATLLKGRQHVDNTLVVDHAVGHCESRELFKAVLDGESRSVFQGKIIVQPHAQKTDAKMATHALLLSEDAEADAKPELEIFADDVVCGHGATAGALDDDLLFYLKARGIPQKEAEALMVEAFVGEAVEAIGERGRARGADGSGACLAEGEGLTDASRSDQRLLRRRPHPAGFPGAVDAGLWQAAGLSRQRRLRAEAEGRARPHPARLYARICQCASRPALSRQCRDRRL